MKGFEEGQKRQLRFHESTNETVEVFLYWLFSQSNPFEGKVEDNNDLNEHKVQNLAVDVWIFADRHFLTVLQNLAMRCLHDTLQTHYVYSGNISKAYEFTAPQSVMRRLLVAEVVFSLHGAIMRPSELENLPFTNISEFTSDPATQFLADGKDAEIHAGSTSTEMFLVDEGVPSNR